MTPDYDHIRHVFRLIAIWAGAFIMAVFIVVLFWHLLMPASLRWLNEGQLAGIIIVVGVTLIVTAIASARDENNQTYRL